MMVPHLHNLRDIGGLPTPAGRTRSGRLYRSAAPLRELPAIAADVAALGVTRVVDLRDSRERELSPRVWESSHLRVHHVPVFGDALATIRFGGLAELYAIMIDRHAAAIATAVDRLADEADEPALVHCTAGKDRTGVVVGVLLEVLGVERADILADYERSQSLLGPDYLADLFAGVDMSRLPGGAAHRATSSPRALLDTALDDIAQRYGGAEALLLAHGVSADRIARLRRSLIEPAQNRVGTDAAAARPFDVVTTGPGRNLAG